MGRIVLALALGGLCFPGARGVNSLVTAIPFPLGRFSFQYPRQVFARWPFGQISRRSAAAGRSWHVWRSSIPGPRVTAWPDSVHTSGYAASGRPIYEAVKGDLLGVGSGSQRISATHHQIRMTDDHMAKGFVRCPAYQRVAFSIHQGNGTPCALCLKGCADNALGRFRAESMVKLPPFKYRPPVPLTALALAASSSAVCAAAAVPPPEMMSKQPSSTCTNPSPLRPSPPDVMENLPFAM